MSADQRREKATRVVAVAATFSADPAKRWIDHWLASAGMHDVQVRLAPYGQLLNELTAPSTFRGASACVGLLNFADWQRHAATFDAANFQADISLFVDCVTASLSTLPRFILLLCPSRPSAAAMHYAAAAERLEALARAEPRFSVLTAASSSPLEEEEEEEEERSQSLAQAATHSALISTPPSPEARLASTAAGEAVFPTNSPVPQLARSSAAPEQELSSSRQRVGVGADVGAGVHGST